MRTKLTTLCIILLLYSAHSIGQTPQSILGNWSNPETQQWEYGFFEEFAIYNGEFWEYESLLSKNNQLTVKLRKGAETQTLKISLHSKVDSICTLAGDKGNKRKLVRYTRQPGYSSPAHDTFANNGYRQDSVVITGYLRHAKQVNPIPVIVYTPFSRSEIKYLADIDSTGRFRVTIPIWNTCEAYLEYQSVGRDIHCILEPDSPLFVYVDPETKDVRFMGKNARINQELQNYRLTTKQLYFERNYQTPQDAYLEQQQSQNRQKQQMLEEYIKEHPSVSHKFIQLQQAGYRSEFAASLMQKMFGLGPEEQLSPAFMEQTESLLAQIAEPYTLVNDTYSFLENYWAYRSRISGDRVSSRDMELMKHLDKEGIFRLTESQKADLENYQRSMEIYVKGHTLKWDSLRIAKETQPFQASTQRVYSLFSDSVYRQLAKANEQLSIDLSSEKTLKAQVAMIESTSLSPLLKELMCTQAFYKHLFYVKKPLSKPTWALAGQLVSHPPFKEFLTASQDFYTEIARQEMLYPESLKGNEHLAGIDNAAELLQQIIAPYKGKVIYFDFWGTWCGPCKEEMTYMPGIKETMKGKDMVYLYFANNSPEDSWKNVIKEFKLTGPEIVHYNLPDEQQRMLEQYLSIRFFPTYMLIRKNGEIADRQAAPPSQKAALINRMNELLAE